MSNYEQTQLAIDTVEANAHEQWLDVAYAVLYELALTRDYFTSEDVTDFMRARYPDVTTHEPRAMGAVIRRGKRDGIIAPTQRFTTSRATNSNAYPKRVWGSLLR